MAQDDEALLRAYPLISERVDGETVEGIENPETYSDHELASDMFRRHRHLIHRLQRIAFEEGATCTVEALEPARQSSAAQLAFALALEREARG